MAPEDVQAIVDRICQQLAPALAEAVNPRAKKQRPGGVGGCTRSRLPAACEINTVPSSLERQRDLDRQRCHIAVTVTHA